MSPKCRCNLLTLAAAMALTMAAAMTACVTPGPVSVEPTSPANPRREAQDNAVNAKPASVPAQTSGSRPLGAAATPVEVRLFLMSKCPFGVQTLDRIFPALEPLGERVKLRLDYIVSEQEGVLRALHGEPEVKGNKQQLCAMELAHSPKAWRVFISCQNRSWRSIPQGCEVCADEAELKRDAFKRCFDGPRGDELLRESMARSQASGARGSPTILIGGQRYGGPRTEKAFLRSACAQAPAPPPAACEALPPEVEVQVVILSDKRCGKRCRPHDLVDTLRGRFFPRLTVTTLDYSDPQGKRLFKQLALERLPAILFKAGVERAEAYPRIERWLQLRGTYRSLKVPAPFDPTAEICDNGKDDTGDGKVDCADRACEQSLICREEQPRRLDLFVMSQCPHGVKALDAMKEVLAHFKGRLEFHVHYIAEQKKEGGFSALHGQPEVEENIRQLCARKLYGRGRHYMKYIWCRNKEIRSNHWRRCAKAGMSARRMSLCVKRQGEKLLAKDLLLAKALEVRASPTWLANNRYKFSGITAEAIRRNICKHNPGMAGCDASLSDDAQASGAACGSNAEAQPPAHAEGEDAVPAGFEAYKVGVPPCDDYIQKFLRCVRDKMPPDTRPLLERSLLVTARKWREVVKAKENTSDLATGCAAALTAAQAALKEYGCTW